MNAIVVRRYDSEGALIGTVSAPLLSARCEYRIVGGCASAELTFQAEWPDEAIFSRLDGVVILASGVQVFAGRVTSIRPSLAQDVQTIGVEGWWQRLAELSPLTDPKDDRFVFGDADDSDLSEILTAHDALTWLRDNVLLEDDLAPLTVGEWTEPAASTKFGAGGFAIYARDTLPRVLETLATMDDCVVGIDAYARVYCIPRATVLARNGFDVRLAEAPPANWKSGAIGIGLTAEKVIDRRGPSHIAVHSRDADRVPGIRTYSYAQSVAAGSRRTVAVYAPGVRTGPSARRLAKGLFRRFAKDEVKIERATIVAGTRRIEPHLGRVRVYSEGELLTTNIAGQVSARWDDPVDVEVTLGESASDPGSGSPFNDPFAPDSGAPPDEPQIDTGDGDNDELPDPEDWPVPSEEIDETDGFDGDGDDLHTNADRDVWTDPPGTGIDGVDYGSDRANDTNGRTGGTGGGGNPNTFARYPAVITANGGGGSYTVSIYRRITEAPWLTNQSATVFPTDETLLDPGTAVFVQAEYSTGAWIIDATFREDGTGESVVRVITVPVFFNQ